ncbi:MAG: prepilin-type N-terminal cleavage/methylation domain-containing protein [Candidatus Gracilibacteria bacterium]|nr:prepilin-type N-terminal cleavage/methylation domain-containing protein [Candidatus Gracilibacteria bacterium]
MSKKAFTLVELIIVITIIGILSSIGYFSYVVHLINVKDASRISQIINIGDGIDLAISKGINIVPENSVDINVSGNKYSTQGEAGKSIIGEIGFYGVGIDPKDGEHFTFALGTKIGSYQIITYLENPKNLPKTTNTVNILGTRVPYVYGKDNIGILLDDSGVPVNKVTLSSININCGVDDGYKMIFVDGQILDGVINQSNFVSGACYVKPANGCLAEPDYPNAIFNIGTPIEANQEWVKGDITESCSYTCSNGYTGIFCEIMP